MIMTSSSTLEMRQALTAAPSDRRLRDFLALGFVPDQASASAYLASLARHYPAGDMGFPQLLAHIIESTLSQLKPADVAIPLTGGLDSRLILGATLEISPSDKITCFTFGSNQAYDLRVASATCQRLGVRHVSVDTSSLIWDFDELTELAAKHNASTGMLAPIDGILMFAKLSDVIPSESPVLSGFFGDALSGKHLPLDAHDRSNPEGAANIFIRKHRTLVGAKEDARLRVLFADFIRAHGEVLSQFAGATPFDLLDFGFRQLQRIKSVATGSFKHCVTPFEDSRWVSYWLAQALSERLSQRAYAVGVKSAFPCIFPPTSRLRAIYRSIVPAGLRSRLRAPRRGNAAPVGFSDFLHRGDPRQNESKRKFLYHCASLFDSRRIEGAASAQSALDRLLESPNGPDRQVVTSAASFEVHDAAGNFSTVLKTFPHTRQ